MNPNLADNLPFQSADAGASCSSPSPPSDNSSGICCGTGAVAGVPQPAPKGPENYTGGQGIWHKPPTPPVCIATPPSIPGV